MIFYHLALTSDWEAAIAEGDYRISTLGKTIDEVGFMHGSFAAQVPWIAETFYAGVTEPLVLLEIDADRLAEPVRVEEAPGTGEEFPHVYGPLPVAAVLRALPVERDAETARFVLPPGMQ